MSRVAVVTGGTRGIGEGISIALKGAGFTVAANYAGNDERANAFSEKAGIAVYKWDVSDADACAAGLARVESELGPIDVVVNNAGITRDATFKKITPEKWQQVINADLDSVFNVSHQFVAGMTDRGWGRVINIASINGQKGCFGQTNYCAAKAGMHGFTMALAQEVARKGVTVNTVSPGYIATEMVMAVREEVREQIVAQIPVGRLGRPEEIAGLVAFLASDDAGFITGANLAANGGQHMH